MSKSARKVVGAVLVLLVAAGVIVACYVAARRRADRDRDWTVTPPALLFFDEQESIQPGAKRVHGMAVGPNDIIYLTAGSGVTSLSAAGEELMWLQTGSKVPACLAVDAGENLYLGYKDRVVIYDNEGRRVRSLMLRKGKPSVTSIAVRGENVFVADAGNAVVWHFETSGVLLGKIGSLVTGQPGSGLAVMDGHLDVAVDPDGALWVANPGERRVERRSDSGQITSKWGKPRVGYGGFTGISNPTDLAIDADGVFYTAEQGISRVKFYGPRGTFGGFVVGAEGFGAGASRLDIAVDSKGRVLVLETGSGKIRVFTRSKPWPWEGGCGCSRGARTGLK